MARARTWIATHKAPAALIAVLVVAFGIAGSLGVARATDSPDFCRAACHEMRPYAEAWDKGPHADIACVECHVDPGAARLTHKVEALGEVVAHVKGDNSFPRAERTPIPDERCIACHENIKVRSVGFDHSQHASRGPCESCHRDAGHEVSPAALRKAGIYNASVQRQVLATKVATVDGGSDNVAGHLSQPCVRCHDMQKTGCASCHKPKHEGAGPAAKTAECTTCHAAGAKFVFSHPAPAAASCDSCHKAPAVAKHDFAAACETCHLKTGKSWDYTHNDQAACASCHERPEKHRTGTCSKCHEAGKTWAFSHPNTGSSCTSCHARPVRHRSGSCTSCHRTGVSWAFSHPSARSGCTSCHARPAQHRSGTCTSCHRTGSTWAFSHPGSSGSCTTCHNRPSGHRSGSCLTCHRAGSSWAFRHPGSSGCSSCHKSPQSHYGTSCASCHSPSRAWGNATFRHARIPGGEHTYKSFACSNCHPNGYGSRTCAKCHDSPSGPDEDD